MGRCNYAPVVEVNHNHIMFATEEKVEQAIKDKDFSYKNDEHISLNTYIKNGGYSLYNKILTKEVSFEKMIDTFSKAGLRGLGGAGFQLIKSGKLSNHMQVKN